MADYTVTQGQNGAYELPLAANTESTVTIAANAAIDVAGPRITVISATAPVYVKHGDGAITVKDPTSRFVQSGDYLQLDGYGGNVVIRLISSASAVVSVERGF